MRSIPEQPSPIHQTDFTEGSGNALQGCIAALFHLPLADVPNFVALPEGYQQGMDAFCRETLGCTCTKLAVSDDTSTRRRSRPAGGSLSDNDISRRWCLLRGKSPRGNFGHVVVAKANTQTWASGRESIYFDPVWDPHPESTFLDLEQPFGWYMVFDAIAEGD